MAAAATDKLRKKKSLFSTTLNGTINSSDTTIALNSTSGLPTDTAITLTIDRVDANSVSTPTLRERVTGVVSSNNLTNCLRGEDGDSAVGKSHSSGAVVEDIWEAETWNDHIDNHLVEHNQDGTHASTIVKTTGTQTISGDKTFTGTNSYTTGNHTFASGKLLATRPKITTSVDDANGNEEFIFTATASAVNELTQANGATGNSPATTASGGDSNVGWDVRMKGTGKFRKPTIVELPIGNPSTNLATGDGQAFFRIPAELNGMNLTGVAAQLYTAGTTNTHDFQIRRVRSATPADMLSTKITIDSTEVDTSTAATAAVINTSNDDVATGDLIAVDIDAVSTTPGKGAIIELRFELP